MTIEKAKEIVFKNTYRNLKNYLENPVRFYSMVSEGFGGFEGFMAHIRTDEIEHYLRIYFNTHRDLVYMKLSPVLSIPRERRAEVFELLNEKERLFIPARLTMERDVVVAHDYFDLNLYAHRLKDC